ncbi:MAG: tRNA pseudouridine(13) synthase TruD [Planctomycetia bacterium]|nr:tRNA pseudouridine(13) synthase TruD [Planctomycetia bacterium]
MKLKQQPADFQVEELTDAAPEGQGPYALYRLDKSGWSTPEALAIVRRRWRIELRRVSSGGLKDRHAQTVQHFTIFRGPQRNLKQQGIAVQYLGQRAEPFTAPDIRANRFRLTLRDIAEAQVAAAGQALTEIARDGVPNYFDDQRFGSANGGRFIGKQLVLGEFESALKQALTAPYEHDRAAQKREKAALRANWGEWERCRSRLPPGHVRDLVDYLARRPSDFLGAVVRLRPELRGLYLSAYQSHLWNRLLARWLEVHCRPEQLRAVRLQLGSAPFPHALTEEQRTTLAALELPLPSARLKLADDDPVRPLLDAVLTEEELQLEQLQVKGVRELFFSKGERAAHCLPANLNWDFQRDDLHAGRRQLVLTFELPRGSYATLLVKRIQLHGE